MNLPLAMIFGYPQMLVVAFVAILLFANRVPRLMRNLGATVDEFNKLFDGSKERTRSRSRSDIKEPPQ